MTGYVGRSSNGLLGVFLLSIDICFGCPERVAPVAGELTNSHISSLQEALL